MTGARRAAELVPADAVVTVPVLETGGEKAAGIRALDVLVENQRLTREALDGIDDRVITVGGDCAVDIAPIAAARARYGDALTVLWIDAHPDVYSPQTLPSGAFHGMVVRALLGDGPTGLTPEEPLTPQQVIIAGERAGDVSEHEYLMKTGLRRYGVDDLERALDGLRGPVYVHIDLDVLEPTRLRLDLLPGAERRAAAATDRPHLPDRRHRRRRRHRARARRRRRRRRGRRDPPVGRRTDALTGRSTCLGTGRHYRRTS